MSTPWILVLLMGVDRYGTAPWVYFAATIRRAVAGWAARSRRTLYRDLSGYGAFAV